MNKKNKKNLLTSSIGKIGVEFNYNLVMVK